MMNEPEETPEEFKRVFTKPKMIPNKNRVSIRKYDRPGSMFRDAQGIGTFFSPKSGFGTKGTLTMVTGGKRKTKRRIKNMKKTRKRKQKIKTNKKANKSTKIKI